MKVGWIGLGNIGSLMAGHMLAAGHQVTGHARTPEKQAALAAQGAVITSSLIDTVKDAEVVCVNVFTDEQMMDAMVTGGALAAMKPGAVLAIHTTGDAEVIQDLAARAPAGVHVLDATFSASGKATAAAEVVLLIGGDPTALEIARPALSAYSPTMIHVGPLGSARRLKLLNNMLFGANVSLAAEVIRAAEQLGLDPKAAARAISVCSGGTTAMGYFAGTQDPREFMASIARYMDKDVGLAREAAKDLGLRLPLLDHAADWGR